MLKIKKVKPMFTSIVLTMDKYEEDSRTSGGLIDGTKQQGSLKEFQRVIAVGDSVRGVKVGDLVCFNPARYAIKQHQAGSMKDGVIQDNPVIRYNFNIIEVDDKQCLVVDNNDISFVIEEYEEVKEYTPDLIIPDTELII